MEECRVKSVQSPAFGSVTGARSDPVAEATDGFDVVAVERPVDLATQVPDVHLDHIGVALELIAPDPLEELLLGDDLARLAHQRLEQLVLAGGQSDLGVAPST